MIDSIEFDKCLSCMRTFFKVKGFVEVHPQSRLSILACEDPQTITTFQYANQLWPLPQTSQMWLDYEMLKDPERAHGYFCVSTSYRNEPNPLEGREIIFPMFEFQLKGGIDKLIELERELLEFMGFKSKENDTNYPEETYRKVAERYGVVQLEHETQMGVDYGDVFFLKHFPNYTLPFWNMKQKYGDEVEKVDVIIHGIQTIGSAERSTEPVEMRNRFKTISDGQYADILYNTFGQQRVDDELELFLNNTFIQRSGGGIDINQMIRAMKLSNLM